MRYSLLLILVVSFFSCKKNVVNNTPVNFTEEKVVLKDITEDGYSFSKRSRLPLVEAIYEDAKTRDEGLNELDNSIRNMTSIYIDSLEQYTNYHRYNKGYYNSGKKYLADIKDTTKRALLKSVILDSEQLFNKNMSDYKASEKKLDKLQSILTDQHLIMKLMVSESMIKAYQKELPSMKTFENLEATYQEMIKKTEKYTDF